MSTSKEIVLKYYIKSLTNIPDPVFRIFLIIRIRVFF